jgi:hypothetical protein
MKPCLNEIYEKLKRADENIGNLNLEIERFFQEGDYPGIPQNNREMMLKAVDYHRERPIPLRFSVLAGEIIHHLRSALDYLMWQLSSEEYRRKCSTFIQFPVCRHRPTKEKELARYNGMIKGITHPVFRQFIDGLQPYKSTDCVSNEPLLILHKMDIADKHQSLVLCYPEGGIELPALVVPLHLRKQGVPLNQLIAELAPQIKQYGKATPYIALRKFGNRPFHPVIPALNELLHYVLGVVASFDELIG